MVSMAYCLMIHHIPKNNPSPVNMQHLMSRVRCQEKLYVNNVTEGLNEATVNTALQNKTTTGEYCKYVEDES